MEWKDTLNPSPLLRLKISSKRTPYPAVVFSAPPLSLSPRSRSAAPARRSPVTSQHIRLLSAATARCASCPFAPVHWPAGSRRFNISYSFLFSQLTVSVQPRTISKWPLFRLLIPTIRTCLLHPVSLRPLLLQRLWPLCTKKTGR